MIELKKRFLGIPVIRIKKTERYEKRYFLGIQYKVNKYARRYQNFVEAFNENIKDISNRDIQVILNNLGEAVIYARTYPFWYKKDALVFGTRRQHADIFKMYCPEIPVFYCAEAGLKEKQESNSNKFEAVLFDKKIIEINNDGKPFLKAWEKYLKADFSNIEYKKAIISEEVKKSAYQKAKLLHLNLDKFVFLMPFARSHELLPEEFWQDIEKQLKNNGFDILYNSLLFSLPEAYVLAEKSKAIISLRSGFNDVLCELPVPQFMIYSHNGWHGDLQPMYTFQEFPWAARKYIKEYNTHKEELTEIKDDILMKIINKKGK